MTKLEKDIEAALRGLVRRHHGLCLKWVSPGHSGVPDRIILLPGGRVYFVELKRPKGGEIAALQLWWRQRLIDLGMSHHFVRNAEELRALELLIMGGNEK